MCAGSHWTKALKHVTRFEKTVSNPTSMRWHSLRMFTVPPKNCYCHYVSVPMLCQNQNDCRMMCLPSFPMFAYCSSALDNNAQRFDYYLRKVATIALTSTFVLCFIQSAENFVAELLWPAQTRIFTDDGRFVPKKNCVCRYYAKWGQTH